MPSLFVGLAVLVCFPLTFLLLSYLACTGPLYRKEKAVYLIQGSRRSSSSRVSGAQQQAQQASGVGGQASAVGCRHVHFDL